MVSNRVNDQAIIWDYVNRLEVRIARPAKDIWPHFFGDKKQVWSKTNYTAVAGTPGGVGEIYRMADPAHHTHFFFEAIRVQPHELLVLKISHARASEGEPQLMGYDSISLSEQEGYTSVVLHQVFSLPLDRAAQGTQEESRKQDQMLADIFQTLKQIVEIEQGETLAHATE
jgi:hypothetical protein